MKKFGFTLLEILLSLGIFSLLIGIILSIYTKMQEAESKIINTQKMVQVAQDFSEKMFNWSLSCDTATPNSNDETKISLNGCKNGSWIIEQQGNRIHASNGTSERYSDSTVYIDNIKFTKMNNIDNLIEMSITTSVPDGDYFTGLAIGTNGFTLTSSYYFDKVK